MSGSRLGVDRWQYAVWVVWDLGDGACFQACLSGAQVRITAMATDGISPMAMLLA